MRLQAIASVLSVVLLAFGAQAAEKRYLVIMKGSSDFRAAQTAFARKSEFRGSLKLNEGLFRVPAAKLALVNGRLEKSLRNLNSLVVRADESQEKLLKLNPGVAYVEEEIFHPLPKPVGGMGPKILATRLQSQPVQRMGIDSFRSTPKTPWGILAVKAMAAWPGSNGGSGARVLVLDTGVDKDHPSLAANLEKGADFVGDNQQPYAYADTIGHGTHVAGTIAAVSDSGGFTGVAPQAKILAGRVCSSMGCSNIAIAQGVNWGLTENVDVISMSLGGMWSTPAERDAITKAEAAGITIVAASGNDGSASISYPAALGEVIAVGAVDSQMAHAAFSQYGPELAISGPGVEIMSSVPRGTGRESDVQMTIGDGAAVRFASTTFEGAGDCPEPLENGIVDAGLGRVEDFAAVDARGKFALMARGELKFIEKVQNAIAAGAVGAIIFNNAPGLIRGALTQDGSKLAIPVFMIEQQAGEQLRQALTTQQPVRSRVAVVATDYALLDGTSMATPHVSGVVALMKSANKSLRPKDVKALLQRTAVALSPNANNEFGAGLVDADAAVRAAIAFQPPAEPALPEPVVPEPVIP